MKNNLFKFEFYQFIRNFKIIKLKKKKKAEKD